MNHTVFMPVVNKINKLKSVVVMDYSVKNQFGIQSKDLRLKNGYPFCRKHQQYLHRLITENKFKIVDHKNKNILDCRMKNLRESNYILNKANSKPHGKRRFKGVRKSWSKFRSTIVYNGKQIHLGMFETETEAAKAYNCAALRYYGDHAELNNV